MAFVQTRVDDLDGSTDDVQPMVFGWRDRLYTVDIGDANRARLDALLEEFIAASTVFGDMPAPPSDPSMLPTYRNQSVATPSQSGPKRGRAKAAEAARTLKTVPAASSMVVPPSAQEIRTWGNLNGYTVAPTGQIPAAVKAAFAQAHA